MRTRWLLALVTVFAFTVMPGVLLGQKKSSGVNSLSVRQKADVEVTNLIRNIKKAKEVPARVNLTKSFLKKINEIRSQNPTQMSADEIYLDMLVGSIEEIPEANQFKVESCEDYKSKIISLYDPRSGGKSQNPALNHATQVIDGICMK